MDKNAWQTLYKVEMVSERIEDEASGSYISHMFQLKTHDGDVVGTYRDNDYAIKQARRKYKKFVRLMEKSLMTLT